MKFLWNDKDGGSESKVWCYGIEIKSLFSIILLRFENGSREAYHSHAFNCLNWILKSQCKFAGHLTEDRVIPESLKESKIRYWQFVYWPSIQPFIIRRDDLHKVSSYGRTWVLSFRGPWSKTWKEYIPDENRIAILTHGRIEVNE